MIKKAVLLLSVFNLILLVTGWVMAFYAYPRLPQRIPLWLNFSGQPVIMMEKSPVFFTYPLAQTIFFLFFLAVSKTISKKIPSWKVNIQREFLYLAMIFFNLIFIHIQRSLILLSHKIGNGVDKYYFYALFCIILILIPYYHIREKLAWKAQS